MAQVVLGSPELGSCRSSHSSECARSSCSSKSAGSQCPEEIIAESSRSTTCDGACSVAWTPSLIEQAARVPKHMGALSPIESRYRFNSRASGAGGFGQVFVANDKEVPGRKVAVKKIPLTNSATQESFHKERDILKQLDHPCIGRVLETYEAMDNGYLVLELCEGGDSFDRLVDSGAFREDAAASLLIQVASALRYAHSKGIAHRDVKPENICYCSRDALDDRVKLIDWGTACDFRKNKMRAAAGSAIYAGPEMHSLSRSPEYTEACDLWSLGVTAYVLLSGSPPFWGDSKEQLKKMKAEQFPMVGGVWGKVSDDAKDFIRALLRPEPSQRLTAHDALNHPFLKGQRTHLDVESARQAFGNIFQSDASSTTLSSCALQVARHLDQKSVRRLQNLFHGLDVDSAGELKKDDIRHGLERVFGKDSDQVKGVDAHFTHFDFDGSGTISFTEFCAVALGGEIGVQDEALQAAFRDFDVHDRCRLELLHAAELITVASDGGEKVSRGTVARWLASVRRETRPLAFLPSAVQDDEKPTKATLYGKLCCLVSGRRRRSGQERRRLFGQIYF